MGGDDRLLEAHRHAVDVALQEAEFKAEKRGYSATRHQREVGAGYFDDVTQTIVAGTSSITALSGSTEEEQFHEAAH